MLQLHKKNSNKGPLWLVEEKYTVGANAASNIPVTGFSIQPHHADFLVDGDRVRLVNLVGGDDLKVNGQVIHGSVDVATGDTIQIGDDSFEVVDPKAGKPDVVASAAADASWALKALNTALEDNRFPLTGEQIVGRSKECDISLGVVHLSRKHAKIQVTDRGLVVDDLGSSNGTFVNGRKVDKAVVVAGDELSFDSLRFRVIGPSLDDDKTTMRPPSDGDLTTVRPALSIPPKNQSKGPSKARAKPQRAAPQSPRSTISGGVDDMTNSDASESKGGALLVVAVTLLVGALVAWLLIK